MLDISELSEHRFFFYFDHTISIQLFHKTYHTVVGPTITAKSVLNKSVRELTRQNIHYREQVTSNNKFFFFNDDTVNRYSVLIF